MDIVNMESGTLVGCRKHLVRFKISKSSCQDSVLRRYCFLRQHLALMRVYKSPIYINVLELNRTHRKVLYFENILNQSYIFDRICHFRVIGPLIIKSGHTNNMTYTWNGRQCKPWSRGSYISCFLRSVQILIWLPVYLAYKQ